MGHHTTHAAPVHGFQDPNHHFFVFDPRLRARGGFAAAARARTPVEFRAIVFDSGGSTARRDSILDLHVVGHVDPGSRGPKTDGEIAGVYEVVEGAPVFAGLGGGVVFVSHLHVFG